MTDREKLVEQLLIELHDLEFHGKNLAHLDKLADFILERERSACHETSINQTKRLRDLIRQEGAGSWQRVFESELAALTPKTAEENFRKVQKLVKEGKISDHASSLHAALGTAPKTTEQKEDV